MNGGRTAGAISSGDSQKGAATGAMLLTGAKLLLGTDAGFEVHSNTRTGWSVGVKVGILEGATVGISEAVSVGAGVGFSEGNPVGTLLGF